MKSKILVPVDRARNSLTAEEYAVKLSYLMAVRITLLNVVNRTRIEGRGISLDDQERILVNMRQVAQQVLDEAAAPLAKMDLEYETRIEVGNPGPLICKLAEEEGFDMVIIPQSGLSELEEILGGSVVRHVLNRCRVPVLLVKHSPEQMAAQKALRAQAGMYTR